MAGSQIDVVLDSLQALLGYDETDLLRADRPVRMIQLEHQLEAATRFANASKSVGERPRIHPRTRGDPTRP